MKQKTPVDSFKEKISSDESTPSIHQLSGKEL